LFAFGFGCEKYMNPRAVIGTTTVSINCNPKRRNLNGEKYNA